VISGAASTGFVALINAALSHPRQPRYLAWAFAGLCIILPLFRFTSNVLLLRLSQRLLFDLRLVLSRRILQTPLRELETVGPARLLAILTDDVTAVVNAVGNLPTMIVHVTVVIGSVIYLAVLSPVLVAVFLVFCVLGIASYQLPVNLAQRHFHRMREAADALFRSLRGLTEGSKELKINSAKREDFMDRVLEPSAEAVRHHTQRGATVFAAANSWGQSLFFIVIGLLLFVLPVFHPVSLQITSGYTLALLYMMTPLDMLLNLLPPLGRAGVAVNRIERLGGWLLEHGPDAPGTTAGALPPATGFSSIELAGVTHSYRGESGEDRFLLGPLTFALKPGEIVFVVGGNGSGKTTFAKLLIGLYSPEQGEVRRDGRAVTDADRDAYRQLFSVVFADFYLFDELLGIPQPELDERVRRGLAALRLEDKVTVRDGALSTLALSQGQRKRLALLAAYLENRPVYVFDEWAADQDPQFKAVFYFEILPELRARGKAVVVISHDDHYYRVADRVLKLNRGQVELAGSLGDPPVERDPLSHKQNVYLEDSQ
jgi:putative pyoverdin transport system ATP-binding/permease protein